MHIAMISEAFRNEAFIIVLILLAVTDLKTKTIPNQGVLTGFFLWAAYPLPGILVLSDQAYFQELIRTYRINMLAGIILFLSVRVISGLISRILKSENMGMGDMKLIFVITLYLGLWKSIYMLFCALVFGILFAAALQIGSKDHAFAKEGKTIPFGPPLCTSAVLFLLPVSGLSLFRMIAI